MYYCTAGSLLVPQLFECELPMMDVMAATRVAVNFGSAVIATAAALTVSANDEDVSIPCKWWSLCPKVFGADINFWAKSGGRRLSWLCSDPCSCEELVELWVRSNVIVGNGAEAERVATFCEQESDALSSMVGFIMPSALGIAPERSIDAAADVVDAIALAVGGSWWLCCPSYVVTNTLRSSAHLCTYKETWMKSRS